MATLLRWAHHDCTSEASNPTEDDIVNDIIAEQHRAGYHCKPVVDDIDFDMTNVKAGSILYIYAQASRKRIEEIEGDD